MSRNVKLSLFALVLVAVALVVNVVNFIVHGKSTICIVCLVISAAVTVFASFRLAIAVKEERKQD